MALLAEHKERLPRPERIARFGASAEARLNATDSSLSPSAGGVIRNWSKPIEGEIRDDQGICTTNPDTGLFMRYHLAGAYDSNIALLLTQDEDRISSYEKLSKVIRRTVLRGSNLATNLEFHYGLVNWFIGNNVMAKPTTRFVVPYLTLVGKLKEEAQKLDVVYAFIAMKKHYGKLYAADAAAAKAASATLDRKGTLLTRPMEILLKDPHMLSGWLSLNKKNFKIEAGKVIWLRNPLVVLQETYEYLNMTWRAGVPSAEVIWTHDRDLLENALAFYAELREKFGVAKEEFLKLDEILSKDLPQGGYDQETWAQIQAAHVGYEIGNELLGLLCLVADKTDFYDLKVEDDLEVTIPEYLHDPELQAAMKKVLVPPPATKADEIVTPGGGMYYGQEAPGLPPFVSEGMHFEKGQPLFILEVMKMFNKVPAPFSGTIDKIIIEGGDGTLNSG
jgi:biotin carboxyl carrier protein